MQAIAGWKVKLSLDTARPDPLTVSVSNHLVNPPSCLPFSFLGFSLGSGFPRVLATILDEAERGRKDKESAKRV